MAKSNAERQAEHRARQGVTKHDPLLQAVIDKLPAPGSQWPADARTAWFDLMAKACDVAYGPAGPPLMVVTTELSEAAARAGNRPGAVTWQYPFTGARYFIDKAGFAMVEANGLAEPLSPYDVPAGVAITDQRVAAVAITWKEGVLPDDEIRGIEIKRAA